MKTRISWTTTYEVDHDTQEGLQKAILATKPKDTGVQGGTTESRYVAMPSDLIVKVDKQLLEYVDGTSDRHWYRDGDTTTLCGRSMNDNCLSIRRRVIPCSECDLEKRLYEGPLEDILNAPTSLL